MFIVTEKCQRVTKKGEGCKTPGYYSLGNTTDQRVSFSTDATVFKYNSRDKPMQIQTFNIKGPRYKGRFRLSSKNDELFNAKLPFFAIENSKPQYLSSHDGQIGLEPQLLQQQSTSFYYALKQEYTL